jgi:hypothetical protein
MLLLLLQVNMAQGMPDKKIGDAVVSDLAAAAAAAGAAAGEHGAGCA